MTATAHLRKGWCPGALRPMQSGDGLLLRVRPKAGSFPIVELAAIAEAASRFGSGEIDLTNRGNLQLRGVSEETYPEALAALGAAGLIDAEVDAEAVRNVVVDPLSGLDPARADIRKYAVELEQILVEDRRFLSLPGKFGFSFSGSSQPRVGGRTADIMIAFVGRGEFAIFIDGDMTAAATVSANEIVDAAKRLAAVFLLLRRNDQSIARMRNAVVQRGSASIFTAAGLSSALATAEVEPVAISPVGQLARSGRIFAAGIGLPFGRIIARELETLCGMASRLGIQVVNTSPERVLVFPVGDPEAAIALLAEAAKLHLITEARDPRLAMDVCPGAPACRNASTETRRDAQHLVDALQESLAAFPSLHISGCEKGCARRGAAALTLVGRNGRYDIVCDDGPSGPVAVAGIAPHEIAGAIASLLRRHHP
jgi:precorrin-3B synthase